MPITVMDFHSSKRFQHLFDWVFGMLDPYMQKEPMDMSNRSMWFFSDTLSGDDAPYGGHIGEMLETFKEKNLQDKNVLVHCAAGVSRSTATAIGLLVFSGKSIDEAIGEIAKQRPFMWPNQRIIKLFDSHLKTRPQLSDAVKKWKDAHPENKIARE